MLLIVNGLVIVYDLAAHQIDFLNYCGGKKSSFYIYMLRRHPGIHRFFSVKTIIS